MEYCFNALKAAFDKRGVNLEKSSNQYFKQIGKTITFSLPGLADFIIFWDKDIVAAKAMEQTGFRVFNNAYALDTTDDKLKTYVALCQEKINIPPTLAAPLMYDVNSVVDTDFLDNAESELGYPMIVKQNTGSQGRQVYKACNREELDKLYLQLRHIPHHYQKMMGEEGADLRIYVVGGKAVAACIRRGTDFKSNLAGGGQISLCGMPATHKREAEKISRILKLDFGAIDFLLTKHSDPLFLEANSNAYFRGIESLGVDIAGKIAEHVIQSITKKPVRRLSRKIKND